MTKREKYLENIVYNELISRGYNVEVGTLKTGQIDFIATRFEEKKYFQVTFHLNDDIIDREFGIYIITFKIIIQSMLYLMILLIFLKME